MSSDLPWIGLYKFDGLAQTVFFATATALPVGVFAWLARRYVFAANKDGWKAAAEAYLNSKGGEDGTRLRQEIF
jgi:hypothetical protein